MKDTADVVAEIGIIAAIITVIVLKIVGIIKIKWIWLLSPVWICFSLGCILVCVIIILGIIKIIKEKIK